MRPLLLDLERTNANVSGVVNNKLKARRSHYYHRYRAAGSAQASTLEEATGFPEKREEAANQLAPPRRQPQRRFA